MSAVERLRTFEYKSPAADSDNRSHNVRFSAIAAMLSLQLVLVGFIASVAAYAPSAFDQWRQDEIEADAVDEQQPYFSKWFDDSKPEAASLVNETGEDEKADYFAVPSSVYGEWRRDPSYVFSQDDKLSEVDERIKDIAEAEVRPPIDSYIGIGYDLLKGNPEGDFTLGGLDPGLRLRSIFKLTDAGGKPIPRNSQNLPTQIEYTRVHTCSSVHRVNAFSGTRSYQKKLDVNVKTSGMWLIIENTAPKDKSIKYFMPYTNYNIINIEDISLSVHLWLLVIGLLCLVLILGNANNLIGFLCTRPEGLLAHDNK